MRPIVIAATIKSKMSSIPKPASTTPRKPRPLSQVGRSMSQVNGDSEKQPSPRKRTGSVDKTANGDEENKWQKAAIGAVAAARARRTRTNSQGEIIVSEQ